MGKYQEFDRLATVEFGDIVVATDRFSIHWERRHLKKGFYRLDNTPDPEWKKVPSFPLHFHSKSYKDVQSSPFIANSTKDYLREFLGWVRVQFDKKGKRE